MSIIRDAGLTALRARNIDEAVPLLEEACRLSPEDFNAFQYLSAAYQQAGRHLDAVNTQIAAVSLQPSNPQARYNLGVIMRSGGYLKEARQAFEQALQLQPTYPQASQALNVLNSSAPMPSAPPTLPAEEPAVAEYAEYEDVPAAGHARYEQAPSAEKAPYEEVASARRTQFVQAPSAETPAHEQTSVQDAAPSGFYEFSSSEQPAREHASRDEEQSPVPPQSPKTRAEEDPGHAAWFTTPAAGSSSADSERAVVSPNDLPRYEPPPAGAYARPVRTLLGETADA